MPANSWDTVAFGSPFNNSLCCPIIPTIKWVIVHIVKSTDCRIIAKIFLNPFKFGFISLQIFAAVTIWTIFCMSTAIDFLLSRKHMFSVGITQIIHQALCLLGSICIAQSRLHVQFRQLCLLYRDGIICTIAILWQQLNGICSLFQSVNTKAEIRPGICIRHFHHIFRAIDGNSLLTPIFTQNLHTTSRKFIHPIFWCFHFKGNGFIRQICKPFTRISRKFICIDGCPKGCTL